MSPQLIFQGLRFPSGNSLDVVSPTIGNGYQIRIALGLLPLDIYRGIQTMRIGNADCSQHESLTSLRDVLERGADVARLTALRAQAIYLGAHREEWRALVSRSQDRLASRTITLIDFDKLRNQAYLLERKLGAIQSEARQLEAHRTNLPREPLTALADTYLRNTLRVEREISHIRSLDAWQVFASAGVIPLNPPDWYGLAEVRFNVGGVVRRIQENRFLEARTDELQHASYEINARLHEFREQARVAVEQARREAELVEGEIAFITNTRRIVENSEAQGIDHARDTLAIEQMSAESDRVFLRALINAYLPYLEDRHGS